MNEMNELEAQLRSWTPRRPSPKIERSWCKLEPSSGARLRRENSSPNPSSVGCWVDWPGLSWSTLTRVAVPTLACLSLTAAILTQSGPGLIVSNTNQPAMIALALSNQNFAPYLPGSFQPNANRLDTFGWTNGGDSPSSMRSLTPPEAIDLQ
jgi:hypothetical protein